MVSIIIFEQSEASPKIRCCSEEPGQSEVTEELGFNFKLIQHETAPNRIYFT